MSADAFQSEYASVMESMMRTAMAQTTKLVESMVNDLRAEISRVRTENELLRSAGGRWDEQKNQRNHPAVQAGDTRLQTAAQAEDYRSLAEKHDRAVQCDLANMAELAPLRQHQHITDKRAKYVLRPHKSVTDNDGNSQMTFTLVKHEHSDAVCSMGPMFVSSDPAFADETQDLELYTVEEKPTLMLIQKFEETTATPIFEEEPRPPRSPIISIATVMSITEEEFDSVGQPNFCLRETSMTLASEAPDVPERLVALPPSLIEHSYALKKRGAPPRKRRRRKRLVPKKRRKNTRPKVSLIPSLSVSNSSHHLEVKVAGKRTAGRAQASKQQDEEEEVTEHSSDPEDEQHVTDETQIKSKFVLVWDDPDSLDEAPHVNPIPEPLVLNEPVEPTQESVPTADNSTYIDLTTTSEDALLSDHFDLQSGIMLLATASEQQIQRDELSRQRQENAQTCGFFLGGELEPPQEPEQEQVTEEEVKHTREEAKRVREEETREQAELRVQEEAQQVREEAVQRLREEEAQREREREEEAQREREEEAQREREEEAQREREEEAQREREEEAQREREEEAQREREEEAQREREEEAQREREEEAQREREEEAQREREEEAQREREEEAQQEREREEEAQREREEEAQREREEEAQQEREREEEAQREREEEAQREREEEAQREREEEAQRERERGEEAQRERGRGEEAQRERERGEEAQRERERGEEAQRERERGEEAQREREREEEAQLEREREEEAQLEREREEEAQLEREREEEAQLEREREEEAQLEREREEEAQPMRAREEEAQAMRAREEEASMRAREEEAQAMRAREEEAQAMRAREEEAQAMRAREEEAQAMRAREEEAQAMRAREEEAQAMRAREEEAQAMRAREEEAQAMRAREEEASMRAREEQEAKRAREEQEAKRAREEEEAQRVQEEQNAKWVREKVKRLREAKARQLREEAQQGEQALEQTIDELNSSQEAASDLSVVRQTSLPFAKMNLSPVVRVQRLKFLKASKKPFKVSMLLLQGASADAVEKNQSRLKQTEHTGSAHIPTQLKSSPCPVELGAVHRAEKASVLSSALTESQCRKKKQVDESPTLLSHPSDHSSEISQSQFLATLAVLPKYRDSEKSSCKDGADGRRSYAWSRMCKKSSTTTPLHHHKKKKDGTKEGGDGKDNTVKRRLSLENKDQSEQVKAKEPIQVGAKKPMMVEDPTFFSELVAASGNRRFGRPSVNRARLDAVNKSPGHKAAQSSSPSPNRSATSKNDSSAKSERSTSWSPGRSKTSGKIRSPERSVDVQEGLQSKSCSSGSQEKCKDEPQRTASKSTNTTPEKSSKDQESRKESSHVRKSGASPSSKAALLDGIRRFLTKTPNENPESAASSADCPPVKKIKLVQTLISSRKSLSSISVARLRKLAKAKAKRRRQQLGKKIGTVKTNGTWIPPTFEESEVVRLQEEELARKEAESSFPGVDLMSLLVKKEPITSPLQPLTVIGKHLLRNQCGECGCKFSCSAALEKHVSMHYLYRPFTCKLCGKCYPNSKAFKRHDRVHRNGRIHVCPQCGKGFVYRYGLAKHIRMVHSRIKPFVCQICNKSYATRQDVESHTRSHTGEKPFSCDFCEKRFIRRVQLNMHLRRHLGERRFWCPECNKGFMDLSNMKKHVLTHTGLKPHACPHCPKTYTQAVNMRKHIQSVHCFQ